MTADRARAGWLALAAAFALGGMAEAIAEHRGAIGIAVSLTMGAALALSWWRPLGAVGVMVLVTAAQAPLDNPLFDLSMPLYTLPGALLMLGARCDARRVALGIAGGVAMFVITLAPSSDAAASDIAFAAVLFLALPTLVGRTYRSRSALNAELRDRTARLARDRETRAGEAASAERRRIAGELHDLVAHAVSGMVVQTGAARRLVAAGDPRSAEAIRAIEDGGREALDELRRLLGVLRHDDADLALAPQPSLARVDALLSRLRAGGLDVTLRVTGEPPAMSPGVDVAGYRLVEEALRGASGPVEVVIGYGPGHVDLAITGASPDPAQLVGLRERVGLFGGELVTARRGDAALRAHLPLTGAGT